MKKLWNENKTAMIALFFGAVILLVFVMGFILRGNTDSKTVFTSGSINDAAPDRLGTPVKGITKPVTPSPTKPPIQASRVRLGFGDKYLKVTPAQKYTTDIYYNVEKVYYPADQADGNTDSFANSAEYKMPETFISRLDLAEITIKVPSNVEITDIEGKGKMTEVYVNPSKTTIQLANVDTNGVINPGDAIASITFVVKEPINGSIITLDPDGTKISSNKQIYVPGVGSVKLIEDSNSNYAVSDLDADGNVCFFTDAMIFIDSYRSNVISRNNVEYTTKKLNLIGDVNEDGKVDLTDFKLFITDYKVQVPESDCSQVSTNSDM